jgi:2-hydroxy-6-oxonona-2,4-dienedioate hydrolase
MPTPAIAALRSRATRHLTPCGDGHTVWHQWGASDNSQRPMLLLHGGSGSWTHWVRNIDALVGAGRQVWVPDLPGFGDSALPPDGMDADVIAAPLEAGLQQLLGTQPVDVVGFSFGGLVGSYWAADFPERVARLVVVGAVGMGLVPRNTVRLKGWRHLDSDEARDAVHRFNLAALMLHQSGAVAGVDALDTIGADTLALHKANVLRDRLPARRLSNTDVLKQNLLRVACPVSAIYGQQDALYPGRHALLQATLQALPRFQQLHWIDQAGHWVQYERAEAFHAALLQLLPPILPK